MNRSLRVANSQQVVGLREVASRLPQTARCYLFLYGVYFGEEVWDLSRPFPKFW